MDPDRDPTDPTPGMNVWGWMNPGELRWLADAAAGMGSVAEIGCLHGRSSFALLTACEGPVYCIDPWDDDPRDPSFRGQPVPSYEAFVANVGHFPNLRIVRDRSPAAAALVGEVDMVFIDGSHDYENVLADVRAWLPLAGKLLCGHDYGLSAYPGVKRAVDEVLGERVTVPEATIWAVWL